MINADRSGGRALPLARAYRRVKPLGARLLPIRPACTEISNAPRPIWGATETLPAETLESRHVGSPKQNRRCDIIHPSVCKPPISLLGLLSLLLTAHPWLSFRYFPPFELRLRFLRCHDCEPSPSVMVRGGSIKFFPGSWDRDFSRGVGFFGEGGGGDSISQLFLDYVVLYVYIYSIIIIILVFWCCIIYYLVCTCIFKNVRYVYV